MVSYKNLGLVNTKEMFARAINGGYAIPAFNFNNMEQLQAIIKASADLKSPVILQVSAGARKYANQTLLQYMAQGAVEYAKELGCAHPEIALHLDHGSSFEICKSCVDMGFSSVMIDGSALPYEENIALTKKVVEYAHQFDVTVEGELGVLAGVEDEVVAAESHYTKPEEVIDFVSRTGVDSLAISIGTSHGAYKFTPDMSLHDMAVEAAVHTHRALHVDLGANLPGAEVSLQHRLVHSGNHILFLLLVHFHHRQAAAVVRHTLVNGQLVAEQHLQCEVVVCVLFLNLDHTGGGLYNSCKHYFKCVS